VRWGGGDREGMNAKLESSSRSMEDFARATEWRCAELMSLMQPMFDLYQVRSPAWVSPPLPHEC
jgi:hypothetical protein